jgi:predicted aconitase
MATDLQLTGEERALLGESAEPAVRMAMRIVCDAARLLGASRLVPICSAHIDGCLYHGDSGVAFAERLVAGNGEVRVPTTLNVGALDLMHADNVRSDEHHRTMARRQMEAYLTLGCSATWTCAPYQVGHRPAVGDQVAWGESNAVAFVNSVLGARTNRYGDFLDICCALTGRAPLAGLHLEQNRRATVLVDTSRLSPELKGRDVFYPVLGTWLGRAVGQDVTVLEGLPGNVSEDQLKALGAAAASSGAVALFHVCGVTPEAPTVEAATGGTEPVRILRPGSEEIRRTLAGLSTSQTGRIDAVALGSPHFSFAEFEALAPLVTSRRFSVPFYVCTARDTLEQAEKAGLIAPLHRAGVTLVTDTCVVVTPILPPEGGVLMTSSGKFAHYAPSTIGFDVVYGSLEECVRSAETGRVHREPTLWA